MVAYWTFATVCLLLASPIKTQVTSDLCPVNCINRTCPNPPANRSCTYGCEDGYWGGRCYEYCPSTCTSCYRFMRKDEGIHAECYGCVDGYYLTDTAKTCTLECPTGCKTCSSATNCDVCKSKYYKVNTECRSCPQKCTICISDSKCTECSEGKYGDDCSMECPRNCHNNICERDKGTCLDGCTDGYSGDKCCVQNLHCSKCATSDVCEICSSGMYGFSCDVSCAENCNERGCDKGDGFCRGCVPGFYGDFCNKTCSVNCDKKACSRDGRTCLNGCVSGYQGTSCLEVESATNPLTIVGIVVGTTIGIAVIVLLLVLIIRTYRRSGLDSKQREPEHNPEGTEGPVNVYDSLNMAGTERNYATLQPLGTRPQTDGSAPHTYENALV